MEIDRRIVLGERMTTFARSRLARIRPVFANLIAQLRDEEQVIRCDVEKVTLVTWDTKERLDGWPIGEFAESRAPLNRNLTSKVYLGEDGFVYTGYIGMGVDRIVGRFDVELQSYAAQAWIHAQIAAILVRRF